MALAVHRHQASTVARQGRGGKRVSEGDYLGAPEDRRLPTAWRQIPGCGSRCEPDKLEEWNFKIACF